MKSVANSPERSCGPGKRRMNSIMVVHWFSLYRPTDQRLALLTTWLSGSNLYNKFIRQSLTPNYLVPSYIDKNDTLTVVACI